MIMRAKPTRRPRGRVSQTVLGVADGCHRTRDMRGASRARAFADTPANRGIRLPDSACFCLAAGHCQRMTTLNHEIQDSFPVAGQLSAAGVLSPSMTRCGPVFFSAFLRLYD